MGAKSTGSHPTTTKADGHLLEYFRNTFVEGGGGTNYVAPTPVGLTASGGVIADYTSGSNVYRAHIFTSSGTFEVTAPGDFDDSLEYLVVAGGGGGGGYSGANGGGGGGAGGLRTNLSGHPKAGAAYPVPAFPTSYTVTIGAGGVHQTSPAPGTDGSNSEFHPTPQSYPSTTFVRSIGGGGGGYNPMLLVVLVVHLVVVLHQLVQSYQVMLHPIQIILNLRVMLAVMVVVMFPEVEAAVEVPVVMVEIVQDHFQGD